MFHITKSYSQGRRPQSNTGGDTDHNHKEDWKEKKIKSEGNTIENHYRQYDNDRYQEINKSGQNRSHGENQSRKIYLPEQVLSYDKALTGLCHGLLHIGPWDDSNTGKQKVRNAVSIHFGNFTKNDGKDDNLQ